MKSTHAFALSIPFAALIIVGGMYKTNSTIVALQADKDYLLQHATENATRLAKADVAAQCEQKKVAAITAKVVSEADAAVSETETAEDIRANAAIKAEAAADALAETGVTIENTHLVGDCSYHEDSDGRPLPTDSSCHRVAN